MNRRLHRVPRVLSLLPGGPDSTIVGIGQLAGSYGEALTVTRSTGKYVTRADGSLVWVLANQPAVGPQGLLVEPAFTNYHLQSQTLNTGWTARGTSISPDALVAPDGTQTGDVVVGLAGAGSHDLYYGNVGTIPSGSIAVSFWVRPPVSAGNLHVQSSTASPGSLDVDLSKLTANAWTRLYSGHPAVTTSVAFSSNGSGSYGLLFAVPSGGPLDMGLWGIQMELGSVVHSYFPTTTAAATSSKDAITMSAAALPVAQGSVSLDFTPNWSTPPSNMPLVDVRPVGNASGWVLYIGTSGNLQWFVDGAGSTNHGVILSWTAGRTYRLRAVWRGTTASLYRDDVLVYTGDDNKAISVIGPTLTIGSDTTVSGPADGYISNLVFRAL